ncbi:MAG: glycosyltransferase family 39 protein, partial [Victivallales bacterium]|nr:glycosyltransferase family 39 protein [Victivallales bacterium]
MNKRFYWILGLLTVAALVLRLAVGFELAHANGGHNPVVAPSPLTDMAIYQSNSDMVARGEYQGEFYFQPFYYAVFLPLIKVVFGNSVGMIIVWQALLGALTVFLSGLSAAGLWNRTAGIVTAGLLTFSNALILYTPFLLIETLQAFFLTLIFYTTMLAVRRRNWIRWSVVGLVLGCSILTRGNVWIFFPALAAAAVWCQFRRRDDRINLNGWKVTKKLVPAMALVIFTLLPQVPFVIHNSLVRGQLSPPSTAAQNVLALGNTPEAPPGGRDWAAGAGAMEYPETFRIWTSDREKSVQRHIWDWFCAEPLAFTELTFRKLLLFWDYREIPNNIAFEYGRMSWTYRVFAHVYSWMLLVLGLAGMLCLFRRIRRELEYQVLTYLVLSYALSIVSFYILARFRVPVLPLLGIFAGIFPGCVWTARRSSSGRIGCLVAFFAAFCLVFFAYDAYRYYGESKVLRRVRHDGVRVRVAPEQEMVLDNGPHSFGGWGAVELRTNTPLCKTFTRKKGDDYKSVELVMPLFWETPGQATIEVNGIKRRLTRSESGPLEFRLSLPCPADRRFDISMPEATAKVFYYVDFQRDYGRTRRAGVTIPGEA